MIGERLKAIRKAKSITIKLLSEATGLNPSNLSEIERGLIDPRLSTIEKIGGALGVSLVLEEQKEGQNKRSV